MYKISYNMKLDFFLGVVQTEDNKRNAEIKTAVLFVHRKLLN